MAGDTTDLGDVVVRLDSKWGEFDVPLTRWMAEGPGPLSGAPQSARSLTTGEVLPLTIIPLPYRDDRVSRALIAAGRIPSPWRDLPWNTPEWGEPRCEVRGPRHFDRSVTDPEGLDRLTADVLRALPDGPVDAEAARTVLVRIPNFEAAASLMVRRLVAGARWAELDTIVQLVAHGGLAEVAPLLCEVLQSAARPPHPGHLVDALGLLGCENAGPLLERLAEQFAYAYEDLPGAWRCINALTAIGAGKALFSLILISWRDWPGSVDRWAAEALQALGHDVPRPAS